VIPPYAAAPSAWAQRPAAVVRRLSAFAVDVLGLGLAAFIVRSLVHRAGPLPGWLPVAVDVLLGAAWFAALPALTDGRTVGQRALALRVVTVTDDTPVPAGATRLLVRAAVLLAPLYACDRVARRLVLAGERGPAGVAAAAEAGIALAFLVATARHPLRRGPHDLLTGTAVLDERGVASGVT
jgi:uncharacterized RDD family membrane protein YckC